jgi:hypothetical protein
MIIFAAIVLAIYLAPSHVIVEPIEKTVRSDFIGIAEAIEQYSIVTDSQIDESVITNNHLLYKRLSHLKVNDSFIDFVATGNGIWHQKEQFTDLWGEPYHLEIVSQTNAHGRMQAQLRIWSIHKQKIIGCTNFLDGMWR